MEKSIGSVYIARNPEDTRTEHGYGLLQRTLGEYSISQSLEISDADAMVVIGGDGSFLEQIRKHDFADIPVTGMGSGTLNYYMSTPANPQSIEYMVRNLVEGDYHISQLPLLELRGYGHKLIEYAMNDLVVKSSGFQAFKAGLNISGAEFEHFVGGGLIFATPQGSSAEAMAYGGSFIREGLPAWTLVPQGKHQSKEYHSLVAPIILGQDDEVAIEVKERQWRPFIVGVDGKLVDWPEEAGKLIIRLSTDKHINRIRLNNNTYLQDISNIFRGTRPAAS